MSVQQIALLAAAAVLVFWMVGAHNRLVLLRSAVAVAWTKVDEALRQRSTAASALHAAVQGPLAAEQGALQAWQAALAEAARAAAALRVQPVSLPPAQAWVAAETALAAASSRVFALIEQDGELRRQDAVAAPVLAWLDASKRLRFARQLFNETALPYDEAIAAFPTRLLVRLFRFGPAGRL